MFCSDTFLNNSVMYFASVLLACDPLVKLVSSIMQSLHLSERIKHFPPVHLSSDVSLFYCRSLGIYRSSAATHSSNLSAKASVMYIGVTLMMGPFLQSFRNKNINEVQKSPCVTTRIRWTDILGVMKYSRLLSSKPWN